MTESAQWADSGKTNKFTPKVGTLIKLTHIQDPNYCLGGVLHSWQDFTDMFSC